MSSPHCIDCSLACADILQNQKAKRKVIFKRADQYVQEYLSQEKEEIRLKREARKTGDFYVPSQPKVYFVVRLKGRVLFLALKSH